MHAPLEQEILQKKFNEIIVASSEAPDPTQMWRILFTQFFQERCKKHLDKEQKFTVCLTGPTTREMGTPFTTVDAFVIVDETETNILAIKMAVEKVEADLALAAVHQNQLRPSLVKIRMSTMCGTVEELSKQIILMNLESCINGIFGAVAVFGDQKRLFQLQEKLKTPFKDLDGKTVSSIASSFYNVAVSTFDGSLHSDVINFKTDIMRPLLAIIDGLRVEFGCEEIVSPVQAIRTLRLKEAISPRVEDLLLQTLATVVKYKWQFDNDAKNMKDSIPYTTDIRRLIDAVAVLRAEAKKRIVITNTGVQFNPNKPPTFDIDPANFRYQDRTFKKGESLLDILRHTDPMLKVLYHDDNKSVLIEHEKHTDKITDPQGTQLKGHVSRIFNNVDNAKHIDDYTELMFLAFDKDHLNEDKYMQWLNVFVPRCVNDLFDGQGQVKAEIKTLLNSNNNWYDRAVETLGEELVNKVILHSYFLNMSMGSLACNPKFQALSSGGMDDEELSINKKIKNFSEKYFEAFYDEKDILVKIQQKDYYHTLIQISEQINSLVALLHKEINNNEKPLSAHEKSVFNKYLTQQKDENGLAGIAFKVTSFLSSRAQPGKQHVSSAEFNSYIDKILPWVNQIKEELLHLHVAKVSAQRKKIIHAPSFWAVPSRVSVVLDAIVKLQEQLGFQEAKVGSSLAPAPGKSK